MSDAVILLSAGASQPTPVSAAILGALESAKVNQEHDGPATFQLLIKADDPKPLEEELPIISGGTFATGNRVRVGLKIGTTECWLIDGVVTYQELLYDRADGTFSFSVTGEDLSVFMRLEEKSVEWPARSSAQIVREILANYAKYGLEASVTAPQNDVTPEADLWIRQQNASDLKYVRSLGAPYGYIFALRCGTTTSGSTSAYWGPPPRDTSSLPALNIGAGSSSDVDTISFAYDGTAAERYTGGSRQDTNDDTALVVSSSTDWPLTKLAATPSITGTLVRTRQFIMPQFAGALATSSVGGLAQAAARNAARAEVTIDGLEYGNIVVPGSVLELRNAGTTFNGKYYIEKVEHDMRLGSYVQKLTLAREGLGTTISGGS